MAVASSIGLAISLWQFAQARRAQTAAEASATEARAMAAFVTQDLLHFADPLGTARPNLSVRDLLDEAGGRIEQRLPDHPLARAEILHSLGGAYEGLGDWVKAGEVLRAALSTAESAQGEDGEITLRSVEALAYMGILTGAYEESEWLYDRVLAAASHLGPDHPLILDAREGRALLDYERGAYTSAASLYEALAADLERLGQTDRLTEVNWSLPDAYMELGRPVEAERLIRSAIAQTEAQTGKDHPRVLWMRLTLGDALLLQGQLDAADTEYVHSLGGLTATLGAQHPNTLTALHYHGHLLLIRGDTAAALPVLEQGYAGRLAAHGKNHPYPRYSAHRVGQALTRLGRHSEAIPLLESTLRDVETAQGAQHPNALDLRCSLAEALLAAGQTDRGRALLDEGLPWARSVLPAQSPRLLRYLESQRQAAAIGVGAVEVRKPKGETQ